MAKKDTKTKEVKAVKKTTLNEALFAFQSENLVIQKKGKGNINGRAYNYATLDDLVNGIRPSLNKYGLMFTQIMDGADFITKLIHVESGQELIGKLPLGNPGSNQDLGSRLTYLRRYALISMLGLVTEEDVDGIQAGSDKILPGTVYKVPSSLPMPSPAAPKEQPQTQVGPMTNTPPSATDTTSEAFKKANQAILSCMSMDALTLITGQVGKSTKLTADEKTSLEIVIINKKADLSGK